MPDLHPPASIQADGAAATGLRLIGGGPGGGAVHGRLDIAVSFSGEIAPEFGAAFAAAEAFWESRLLGYREPEAGADPALSALEISASLTPIDGRFGTIGFAGAGAVVRPGLHLLPSTGFMTFDTADARRLLDRGDFEAVVRHEMAHVLGFSDRFWADAGAVSGHGEDESYTGPAALEVYRAEFDPEAAFVPVEGPISGTVRPGTSYVHWDEALFARHRELTGNTRNPELMTGFLTPQPYVSETTVASFADIGYAVAVSAGIRPEDDFPASTATQGRLAPGGTATGRLETEGDRDWFALPLTAGAVHVLELHGAATEGGALAEPALRLRDAEGSLVAAAEEGGAGMAARVEVTAPATGLFYVEAAAAGDAGTGSYTLSAGPADDFAAGPGTAGLLTPGGRVTGALEMPGDRDWVALAVTVGTTYRLEQTGAGGGGAETLAAPVLRLRDGAGALLDSAAGRTERTHALELAGAAAWQGLERVILTLATGQAVATPPGLFGGAATAAEIGAAVESHLARMPVLDALELRVPDPAGSRVELVDRLDSLAAVGVAHAAPPGLSDGITVTVSGRPLPDPLILFTAPADGTVFLEAGAAGDAGTGSYRLAATALPEIDPNLPPEAAGDTARTAFATAVTIPVLANDTDPEEARLALSEIVAPPAQGTAEIMGDAVVYTPGPGAFGADSFVYRVADPAGASDTATVDVTVAEPVQDLPAGVIRGSPAADLLAIGQGAIYLGNGGEDVFLVSRATVALGTSVIAGGDSDRVQLIPGLEIVGSLFVEDAVELVLRNGAAVQVLEADRHLYDFGGNATLGAVGEVMDYAGFAALFGVAVPVAEPVAGGALVIPEPGDALL